MSKAAPSSRPAVAAPDVVPEGLSEGSSGTPLPAAVVEVNGEEDEEEMDEDELDEDEVEGEGYESSSPSTNTSTLTWITWFCSLPGHEYFCEVAEDFIEDDFNLTGLNGLVPFYKEAMEMVLDVEAEEESHRVPDVSIVESSAELLYGLIHQRFIITRQGLQQMYAKYDASHFGLCPRVYCTQNKLVPCGRSDLPGVDTVKLYCPSCVDMYVPPSSRFLGVDGAFFGTTFPHLLFQTYPSALPFLPSALPVAEIPTREPTNPITSLAKVYVPRIYGFKVGERARSGPRMQWLRMRPRVEGELEWKDGDVLPVVEGASGEGDAPSALFGQPGTEDDEIDDDEEEQEEEQEGDMGMSGIVGTAAALSVASTSPSTLTSNAIPVTVEGARGRARDTHVETRVYRSLPSPRTSLPSAPVAASSIPPPQPAKTELSASLKRNLAAAGTAISELPKLGVPTFEGRSGVVA